MSTQAVRADGRHGCTFCIALQRFAVRRRDLGLIEAAERLSAEHLAADTERARFTAQVRVSIRRATPSLTRSDRRR